MPKINDDLLFKVDITEDEPMVNVSDEIAITQFRLDNNLISIFDLMAKQNPDITNEDEIAKILEENKKINQKYLNNDNGKAEETNNGNNPRGKDGSNSGDTSGNSGTGNNSV